MPPKLAGREADCANRADRFDYQNRQMASEPGRRSESERDDAAVIEMGLEASGRGDKSRPKGLTDR
jgi:hypothetical protein